VCQELDCEISDTELAIYPHYLLKEIFTQPSVVENAMRRHLTADGCSIKFGSISLTVQEFGMVDRLLLWACRRADRLIDKYVGQPCLMKLNMINIDENCLSSDVVSIAFAYFLNPPHPSLKYVIQFLLVNNLQNLLQGLKKLVLASHLNSLELSFIVGNKKKSLEIKLGK
jgi:hypothetical protein